MDRLSNLDCNYKSNRSFMWSLIQVFFIVPITSYTFFWGVYDFGPKHHRRTLFDILLNPVPGMEFEGRLGKSDDFDSL